ncbi:MAG: hypothetical protein ACLQQ4_03595 [Bacteroidia bacterium]
MEKKDIQTIQNIRKHAFDEKRPCMYLGCQEDSINSHILQRKGILDRIAENGHVIQIKVTDYFKMVKEGPVTFDRIGVGKAISLPLFCNDHDTKVFKPIESGFNISDYQSQLLYSYRAVCAEVRRKEINIDGDERIIAAKSLDTGQNRDFLEMSKLSLSGERIGFKDISMLKSDFDAELFGTSTGLFEFEYFSYGFLGVCASATFSPETKNPDLHTNPKLVQVILDKERLHPHLIPPIYRVLM